MKLNRFVLWEAQTQTAQVWAHAVHLMAFTVTEPDASAFMSLLLPHMSHSREAWKPRCKIITRTIKLWEHKVAHITPPPPHPLPPPPHTHTLSRLISASIRDLCHWPWDDFNFLIHSASLMHLHGGNYFCLEVETRMRVWLYRTLSWHWRVGVE